MLPEWKECESQGQLREKCKTEELEETMSQAQGEYDSIFH